MTKRPRVRRPNAYVNQVHDFRAAVSRGTSWDGPDALSGGDSGVYDASSRRDSELPTVVRSWPYRCSSALSHERSDRIATLADLPRTVSQVADHDLVDGELIYCGPQLARKFGGGVYDPPFPPACLPSHEMRRRFSPECS